MKCQILFSGKTKKNIVSLSSAETAKRIGKVNSTVLKGIVKWNSHALVGLCIYKLIKVVTVCPEDHFHMVCSI